MEYSDTPIMIIRCGRVVPLQSVPAGRTAIEEQVGCETGEASVSTPSVAVHAEMAVTALVLHWLKLVLFMLLL